MLAVIACVFACLDISHAEQKTEPGGTAEASQKAVFQPAQYAWELFFFLSQQGKADAAGVPDPSKASFKEYDADQPTVWETWALASGQQVNKSEVFKRPATKPVPWEELRAQPAAKILSPSIKSSPLLLVPNISSDKFLAIANAPNHALFIPQPEVAGEDETRMNRNVYETVRSKELYSIEGILRRYAEAIQSPGPMLVTFDQNAKEVKARWVRIADDAATKARYHWRTIDMPKADGTTEKQVWGLVALHVITRDLPNWFWADFSHVDAEKDFAWCGTPDDPTGETCPVDDTTRGPNAPSGTNGIRTETKGTKWENYILRGAQVAFSDSTGRGTVLSNPIIEQTFQRSSCITCHARAAVRPSGTGDIVRGQMTEDIGPPDPAALADGGRLLQIDFLWSIPFRAGGESESPPEANSLLEAPRISGRAAPASFQKKY